MDLSSVGMLLHRTARRIGRAARDLCSSRAIVPVLAALLVEFCVVAVHAQTTSLQSPVTGARFVRISAGSFTMGSPADEPDRRGDEPLHPVTLTRDFWMATTEVSQRQWLAVMSENPSYLYDCADCPVEQVSWIDAILFCNALSAREGLRPAYVLTDSSIAWDREAEGYRLPTEAEWEYAARAGATTMFTTGTCLPGDVANYDGYRPGPGCEIDLSRGQTIAVGSLRPNAWGLHDVQGNVYEWCWDVPAAYARDGAVDPTGAAAGSQRIVRGGCHLEPALRCRLATRGALLPDSRSSCVGFRLARNAS